MFIDLSNNISKIKDAFYPIWSSDVNVTSATLDSFGGGTSLTINFSVLDRQNKILNNETAKEHLKLKTFQVLNEEFKTELSNANSLNDINKIFTKYAPIEIETVPSIEYIEILGSTIYYRIRLLFQQEQFLDPTAALNEEQFRENLEIGMFFYYDYDPAGVNTEDAFLNSLQALRTNSQNNKLFYSNPFYLKILSSDDVVTPVIDKRIVKALFTKEDSADIGIRQQLFQTLNDLSAKPIKILSESIILRDKEAFFSNIYLTRNVNNDYSFIFSVNFDSLIKNNSNEYIYSFLARAATRNSPLQLQRALTTEVELAIKDNVKLSSLKILRRKVKKNNKESSFTPSKDLAEPILEGSPNPEAENLVQGTTVNGIVREIKLKTDSNFRNFEAIDQTVTDKKRGLYQYGVYLNISDDSVKNLRDTFINSSLASIQHIQLYYEDTSLSKYYDPALDSFNFNFIYGTFRTIHAENIRIAVENLINLFDLIGILQKFQSTNNLTDYEKLFQFLFRMVDPRTASASTILQFSRIYSKAYSIADKMFSAAKSNFYTIENWFTNEIVDASLPSNTGYDYLDSQVIRRSTGSQLGLLNVTKDLYQSNITTDILNFNGSNNLIDTEQQKALSSIAIKRLHLSDAIYNLLKPNDLSPAQFSDIELKIKNYNDSVKQNLDINFDTNVKNNTSSKNPFSNLPKLFGVNLDNIYEEIANSELIKNQMAATLINRNINTKNLYLMLSRGEQFNDSIANFVGVTELVGQTGLTQEQIDKLFADAPYQINLLFAENYFLLNNDANFIKNLNLVSKFFFLYNTLSLVEYLTYVINDDGAESVRSEKWNLLDNSSFNSLISGETFLCRLRLYQEKNLNINYFDQVKLPFYDTYFLLKGSDQVVQVAPEQPQPTPETVTPTPTAPEPTEPTFTPPRRFVTDVVRTVLNKNFSNIFTNLSPVTQAGINPKYELAGFCKVPYIAQVTDTEGNFINFEDIHPDILTLYYDAWLKTEPTKPNFSLWLECEKQNRNAFIFDILDNTQTNPKYIQAVNLINNLFDPMFPEGHRLNVISEADFFVNEQLYGRIPIIPDPFLLISINLPEIVFANFLIRKYNLNTPLFGQ